MYGVNGFEELVSAWVLEWVFDSMRVLRWCVLKMRSVAAVCVGECQGKFCCEGEYDVLPWSIRHT